MVGGVCELPQKFNGFSLCIQTEQEFIPKFGSNRRARLGWRILGRFCFLVGKMTTMTLSLGLIKLNKSNYMDKVVTVEAKLCHTCTKIANTISCTVRWDLRSCRRDNDKHKVRGLGHTDRTGVSEQVGKCCVRANIEGAGVNDNTLSQSQSTVKSCRENNNNQKKITAVC